MHNREGEKKKKKLEKSASRPSPAFKQKTIERRSLMEKLNGESGMRRKQLDLPGMTIESDAYISLKAFPRQRHACCHDNR
jgi:hypothetical protein